MAVKSSSASPILTGCISQVSMGWRCVNPKCAAYPLHRLGMSLYGCFTVAVELPPLLKRLDIGQPQLARQRHDLGRRGWLIAQRPRAVVRRHLRERLARERRFPECGRAVEERGDV